MKDCWRECKLGDLLEIKHGFAFQGEYFANTGTHIVLTPGNFYDEGGFKHKDDKEKWYTGPIPPNYVLSEGDLIIAMTEQAEGLLGSSAIIPRSGLYLHNQRLGLVQVRDETKVDRRFLYYLFNAKPVRQQIRSSASGTKVRHTAPSRVADVKVRVPSFPVQRRIAGILSAYDDLIENNQRRIKILEEMAHSLYREWFVNFNYPGHEKVPLVDSLLGPIPRGWEFKTLKDVCSKLMDGTHDSPRPSRSGYPLVTARHIKNGFIDFSDTYLISEDEHQKVMKRSRPEKGDIIYSNIGTLGEATLVDQDFEYSIKNVALFKPLNESYSPFIYCYLADPDTLRLLQSKASGTSQKFFSLDFLRATEIVVPPGDLLGLFARKMLPLLEYRSSLNKSNDNLRRTRNLLLPRLLSGQIAIPNVKGFERTAYA